jgi:hypothetical protein
MKDPQPTAPGAGSASLNNATGFAALTCDEYIATAPLPPNPRARPARPRHGPRRAGVACRGPQRSEAPPCTA